MKNYSFLYSLTILILCLSLSIISACSSSKGILVTIDSEKNFSNYKTFSWASRDHGLNNIKDLNVKYVVATIKHDVNIQLTKHGLSYSDTSSSNLYVDYILLVKENNFHSVDELNEQKQDLDMSALKPKIYFHGNILQDSRKMDHTPIGENVTVQRDDKEEEETLIIFIKDKKNNQIVWKGQCTKRLIEGEDFSTELPSGIRKMFKYFPMCK